MLYPIAIPPTSVTKDQFQADLPRSVKFGPVLIPRDVLLSQWQGDTP
jgi:hypothetical protein